MATSINFTRGWPAANINDAHKDDFVHLSSHARSGTYIGSPAIQLRRARLADLFRAPDRKRRWTFSRRRTCRREGLFLPIDLCGHRCVERQDDRAAASATALCSRAIPTPIRARAAQSLTARPGSGFRRREAARLSARTFPAKRNRSSPWRPAPKPQLSSMSTNPSPAYWLAGGSARRKSGSGHCLR